MTIARHWIQRSLTAVVVALAAACGGDKTNGNGGTGGGDGGTNGNTVDSGVRALCPVEANPACTMAEDCMSPPITPPTNCKSCVNYNRAVCNLGQCMTPTPITAGDPVNYLFQVGNLTGTLESFAGFAITAESSGGQVWTCDDVYAGRVDLQNQCHNFLDTRGQDIARPENQYTMTFTRFAGGQLTLFIVYGYAQAEADGAPIGVSCASQMIPGPGGGLLMIPGDTMRSIQ